MGFGYGRTNGLIRDFNLHVRAGEKIGLVGRSGAGKTTLVNLLLRFHDTSRTGVSSSTGRTSPT